MLSTPRLWTVVSLLGLGAKSVNSGGLHHYPHYNLTSYSTTTVTLPTTIYEAYPNGTVTRIKPTVTSPTTIYETYNGTVTKVSPTTVVSSYPVPYPTTALDTTTTTVSVPVTVTNNSTVYYTTVVPTTRVSITTIIVPTTITPPASYITITATPPVDEECPTTCSIVAGTVRLFFWPTSNDYTYPSTYVETNLDYTFTSPSVYLVINTIYGTNSIGRAGPSGTSEVFAVDLDEVSTILPGPQITRQLTLNDLRTDCPQSADIEVIATTIPDGHCDFSLLAPETVKQWALPCNACGRLGLFDPPYAIPTLGGGLIGPTTTTTTDVEPTTFTSTTSPASGATSTIVTATTTTVAQTSETSTISSTGVPAASSPAETSDPTTVSETTIPGTTIPGTTIPGSTTIPGITVPGMTTVPTASATRVTDICGVAWLILSLFIILWL